MPAHAQPPAAYTVVVEYEDGTVGTSLVVDQAGQVVPTPSRDDLLLVARLVARSLADEDEQVHYMGGYAAPHPDPSVGVFYRVADSSEDDGIDVYVQPMGRVRTRA